MSRIASICFLVAVLGDFFIPYAIAPFYKGYSHKKQVMSVLGNAECPLSKVYNAWLVLLGLLLACGNYAVFMEFKSISFGLTVTTIVLIFIFALGAGILSGFFSISSSDNGEKMSNLSSKIHGYCASIGFMTMSFVPLTIAILAFKSGEFVFFGISCVSFVLTLLFFTLFVMSDKKNVSNFIQRNEGTWQRLSLCFMYLPILYFSLITIFEKPL